MNVSSFLSPTAALQLTADPDASTGYVTIGNALYSSPSAIYAEAFLEGGLFAACLALVTFSGWLFAYALKFPRRRHHPEPPEQKAEAGGVKAFLSGLVDRWRSLRPSIRPEIDNRESPNTAKAPKWPWVVFVPIFATMLLWSSAFHTYELPPRLYAWTVFLFDWHHVVAALAFGSGVLLGVRQDWASSFGDDIRQSLFGDEKRRSPVLQTGAMALALAAIVLILVPINGGKVEEFEGGGVKFKFAIAAPATNRRIQLTGSGPNYTRTVAKDWIAFSKNCDRLVLPTTLLFASSLAGEEKFAGREALLTKGLSERYMQPLSALLSCVDDVNPPAAQSEFRAVFTETVDAWRTFTTRAWFPLNYVANPKENDVIGDDLAQALDRSLSLAKPIQEATDKNKSNECGRTLSGMTAPDKKSAADVSRDFRALTSERGKHMPLNLYFVTYISVLVQDAFGLAEKTRFLDGFRGAIKAADTADAPALLNFYLQLADAKNRSDAHWPLNDFAADNKRAEEIVDDILSRLEAARLENRPVRTICDVLPRTEVEQSLYSADCRNPQDRAKWTEIIDYYRAVRFRVLAQYVDAINSAKLAGRTLPANMRERWRGYFDELQAIMSARSGDPIAYREVQSLSLSRDEQLRWEQNKKISPHTEWNVYNSLALSAILLLSGQDAPAKEACASAYYDVARARERFEKESVPYEGVPDPEARVPFEELRESILSQVDALCKDSEDSPRPD